MNCGRPGEFSGESGRDWRSCISRRHSRPSAWPSIGGGKRASFDAAQSSGDSGARAQAEGREELGLVVERRGRGSGGRRRDRRQRSSRTYTRPRIRASRSKRFTSPRATNGADLDEAFERGRILAESQNFTRDLANEPANLMTPTDSGGSRPRDGGRVRARMRNAGSGSHAAARHGIAAGRRAGQRRAAGADHRALQAGHAHRSRPIIWRWSAKA